MNYQPLIPENLIRKIKEDRGAFTVDSVIELWRNEPTALQMSLKKNNPKQMKQVFCKQIDDKKQLEVDAKNIVEMMKF